MHVCMRAAVRVHHTFNMMVVPNMYGTVLY